MNTEMNNEMNIDDFIKKIEIILDNIFLYNNYKKYTWDYLLNFNIEINKLHNNSEIYKSIVYYIEIYIEKILLNIYTRILNDNNDINVINVYFQEYNNFIDNTSVSEIFFSYYITFKENDNLYNFKQTCYKKWFNYVFININNIIINSIITIIDNKLDDNIVLDELDDNIVLDELDDNIVLDELDDNIVLADIAVINIVNDFFSHIIYYENYIIKKDIFNKYFGYRYLSLVEKKLIIEYYTIKKLPLKDYINKIENIYKTYYTIFDIYGISRLKPQLDDIIRKNILSYSNIIKIFETSTTLNSSNNLNDIISDILNFKKFRESYIIKEENIKFLFKLNICFVSDNYNFMEEIIHNYFKDLYNNIDKTDIYIIIDFVYFMNEIFKKINIEFSNNSQLFDYKISNYDFFYTIFKLVESYIFNSFNTIEIKEINNLINKFIITKIYNNKFPLQSFIKYIITYLGSLEVNKIDELFIYYRTSLIYRLYKSGFNSKIIDIENNIIHSIKNNSQPNDTDFQIYKLKRIISDIRESRYITTEFNDIYGINSQIIIARYSIWGIDSNNENIYNNYEFSDLFNKFTNKFENYYCNQKYEKRKLIWNNKLSYCSLCLNNNSKITITCSLLQSNLLYKFNYNEIIDIDKEPLTKQEKMTLKYLIKNKILQKKQNIISINSFNNIDNTINIDIRDIGNKNKNKNNKNKNNKNKNNIISSHNSKNEIYFNQEDYINLFIMRTLKQQSSMDKSQLIVLTKKKYGYKEEIICKSLDKLVDRLLINFYSIDNREMYSYVV